MNSSYRENRCDEREYSKFTDISPDSKYLVVTQNQYPARNICQIMFGSLLGNLYLFVRNSIRQWWNCHHFLPETPQKIFQQDILYNTHFILFFFFLHKMPSFQERSLIVLLYPLLYISVCLVCLFISLSESTYIYLLSDHYFAVIFFTYLYLLYYIYWSC